MELLHTKILVAFLFGIFRFIFGILPVKLCKFLLKWEDGTVENVCRKRHEHVTLSIVLCQSFGGGVMFATCFLHITKELYFSVEDLKILKNIKTGYPLSQLTTCLGFLFVYFAEEWGHWLISKRSHKVVTIQTVEKLTNALSKSQNNLHQISTIKEEVKEDNDEVWRSRTSSCNQNERSNIQLQSNRRISIIDSRLQTDLQAKKSSCKCNCQCTKEPPRANISVSTNLFFEDAIISNVDFNHKDVEKIILRKQTIRAILCVIGLTLHSIIEGLSIGLQEDNIDIWYMFVAISIHSATLLFCIGLEMFLGRTRVRFIVIHMIILASATPLGVVIGIVLSVQTEANNFGKSTAIVFFESLSAGTILYITFFEILNREKERRVHRLRRGICICVGFLVMALLQYVETTWGGDKRQIFVNGTRPSYISNSN